jgi:hypothetical protein
LYGWVCGVLLEILAKSGCLDVVFWWCKCGVLGGWRGVLAVTFWGGKNVTGFRDLFLGIPVMGIDALCLGHHHGEG